MSADTFSKYEYELTKEAIVDDYSATLRMKIAKEDLLRCSFCGKSQEALDKLIAGPDVYICNECIDLCNEICSGEYEDELEVGD